MQNLNEKRGVAHGGMLTVALILFAAAATLISIVLGALKVTGALTMTWLEVFLPLILLAAFFVVFSFMVILGMGIYVLLLALLFKFREWRKEKRY